MRDDEPWYQDVKGRLLNASLVLDRPKSDELCIANALWEMELAVEILQGKLDELYDENEKKRMAQ